MTLAYWVAADGTEVALDGSDGVEVLMGATGLDGPAVSNTFGRRVGADGSVLLQTRRPERQFSLPLLIDVATITAATAIRLFQGPGTLISSSGRELRNVVYEDGLGGVWSPERGAVGQFGWRTFDVELLALDPWWYGEAVTESFTLGAATAWNAAIAWNSAIPWNGGSSLTLTVLGDAPAFPLWTLTGELSTLTVSNGAADGGSWTWESTLVAGAYGTVDHRPGSKSPRLGSALNGMAESGFGLWFLVSEASSLDWGLTPGDLSLTVGNVTGEGASTGLSVWYEPRWLTP